jgi:putative DNA methylase
MDLALIPERTLLDVAELPFGDLVRFAAREGRRPRPIYQIHKWFARRLGCLFRALLPCHG